MLPTNYKFWKDPKTGKNCSIQTFTNGSWDNNWIPVDAVDNAEYDDYLEWAKTNTTVPAD